MSKKVSKNTKDAVKRDLARGMTQRAVAERHGVSLGTVHSVAHEPSKRRTPTKAPSRPVAASAPLEATRVAPLTREALQEGVAALVADLRSNLDAAKASGDQVAVGGAARLLSQAMALAEKVTPHPAPVEDPNQNPDFVALAAKCKAELLKLIDPALVSAPLGPPCPTCGARRPEVSPC